MALDSNPLQPIFILGATASGKTHLAIELASRYPVEIISVDSALVYRHMTIGTAKPTAEELQRAPHYLIDIVDPWQSYSVSQFIDDARCLISEIQARGNIPLLVGGTMMYFKALESGLSDLPSANEELRQKLEQRAQSEGWAALHAELEAIDPVSAQRIHRNDPQRIQRALEVWHFSGKTMTEWHQEGTERAIRAHKIGLFPEKRELLHARIEERFIKMLADGFIEEVESLRQLAGMHRELPSMRSVGYRQAWEYLDGDVSYSDMQNKAVAATRQLAKRQITWMRGMDDLIRFDSFALSMNHIENAVSLTIEQQLAE